MWNIELPVFLCILACPRHNLSVLWTSTSYISCGFSGPRCSLAQLTAVNMSQRSSDCHVLIQTVIRNLHHSNLCKYESIVYRGDGKTELGKQMMKEQPSLHMLTDRIVNTQTGNKNTEKLSFYC